MKREQKVNVIQGTVILAVGILVGIAYLCKFFPLDPIKYVGILAGWSYIGWMFALLIILYGLCKIMIDGGVYDILEGNLK